MTLSPGSIVGGFPGEVAGVGASLSFGLFICFIRNGIRRQKSIGSLTRFVENLNHRVTEATE